MLKIDFWFQVIVGHFSANSGSHFFLAKIMAFGGHFDICNTSFLAFWGQGIQILWLQCSFLDNFLNKYEKWLYLAFCLAF